MFCFSVIVAYVIPIPIGPKVSAFPTEVPAEAEQQEEAKSPPNDQRALPSAEVLIDVGHGGIDGGTHHEDVLEKDINLAVAKKPARLIAAQPANEGD